MDICKCDKCLQLGPGACYNIGKSDAVKEKALDIQVGGGHYKGMKIQPIEYCMANGFNACQSHAIKYISRTKGDIDKQIEDRRKAIHCIELEIGFLEGEKE